MSTTGNTPETTSSFQNAKFKGQSARQVMASNALNDLEEDALALGRRIIALQKFFLAFRLLHIAGGICAGISLAMLWFWNPLPCFGMAAVSLAFRYYSDLRAGEIRELQEELTQKRLLKLQGAANMRIWLAAVVQSN